MKVVDTILRYPCNSTTRRDGICRAGVFVSSGGPVLLLTDLDDLNTGQSVTNAIESIWRTAIENGLVDASARVVEHYERSSGGSLDAVTFSADGSPDWHSLDRREAMDLLGCSVEEFDGMTASDPRLMTLIQRIRNSIDPFIDGPHLESRDVILRRMDIDERKITKASVVALVESGSSERELQALLKKDLSIFGEIYAHPHEEYIAFSEFPVGDGFVDFAIFTGRSRMDVVLIEIKGADFYLANSDSYGKFASKIEEGAHQIRTRLGVFTRTYQEFRSHVHEVRARAESGSAVHNAFIGPESPLRVDANKDVNVRYVVIGGRTRDDLHESRMRDDYERSFNPTIKLESWDSWLRKLRRV
jgi:hypothetical protein